MARKSFDNVTCLIVAFKDFGDKKLFGKDFFVSNESNISEFLYTPGRNYVIPVFQRPYSWEKEDAELFVMDNSMR